MRGRFTRTDFENRRYELVAGLLKSIHFDESSDVKLRLMLGPESKSRLEKGTTYFETPWLEISGTLSRMGTSHSIYNTLIEVCVSMSVEQEPMTDRECDGELRSSRHASSRLRESFGSRTRSARRIGRYHVPSR